DRIAPVAVGRLHGTEPRRKSGPSRKVNVHYRNRPRRKFEIAWTVMDLLSTGMAETPVLSFSMRISPGVPPSEIERPPFRREPPFFGPKTPKGWDRIQPHWFQKIDVCIRVR